MKPRKIKTQITRMSNNTSGYVQSQSKSTNDKQIIYQKVYIKLLLIDQVYSWI